MILASALLLVFLAFAPVLAIAAAAPAKGETFEAIMWGDLATPEREWTDEEGIYHFRNMVLTYAGERKEAWFGYWYPCTITTMELNAETHEFGRIGTMMLTADLDIDPNTGDGRLAYTVEATLYGEGYKANVKGSVDNWQFSTPFVLAGKSGSMKGIATATLGQAPVLISGMWIR